MNGQEATATFMGASIGVWSHNIVMALVLGLITFLGNKVWNYLWNKYIKKN